MLAQEKEKENNIKNLYLDREKINYIQFNLENNISINSIITNYKDILKDKIEPIYKVSIEDCHFLIIENRITKKDDIPSLMEFRVNKKTKLFNLLQNSQNNLFFLPKKKSSLSDRQKARNKTNVVENNFEDSENDYFSNKTNEEYISKLYFYFYDSTKQMFTKEKGSVDKNKITIYKSNNIKNNIEIYIKNIIKDLYYSDISPAPYRKNLPIKGDRPKFYIEITTHEKTYFFAQFKDTLNLQWENAIKMAITKYKNFNIELNLNIKIESSKTSLFALYNSIINNCFYINKILFNEFKRKMFFHNFPEKKISAIINNIIMYKNLIRKNKYLETWMRFKEILTYIESYNINNENKNIIITEDNKIYNIFTQERIKKYRQISDACNENVKKIKIEESSYNLFENEIKNALNDIMKENLFDDIFYYLYELYVLPYFGEIKKILEKGSFPDNKPLIRQKFQFLLALYFNQIFNMSVNNYYLMTNKINENEQIRNESYSNYILIEKNN